MTIRDWVAQARTKLAGADIPSSLLDSQLILSFVLKKDRTWLIAHDDTLLTEEDRNEADEMLARREQREPIAYITSKKAFYGREFYVTSATLIPRPESETIISSLKQLAPLHGSLLDVGTGSGILGITSALEFPELEEVCLADISVDALHVAEKNCQKHKAPQSTTIRTIQSDLLSSVSSVFDYIIANLPYVDETWEISPETSFEPSQALFASDNGLSLIFHLIEQTGSVLASGGYLILEADPRQFAKIKEKANLHSLVFQKEEGFILQFQKV